MPGFIFQTIFEREMDMMRDVFDSLSPIDYRYWREDVAKYLSENARVRYCLYVEVALVQALHRRGICAMQVWEEVEQACEQITTQEVYEEEARIRHDIRAIVNCIQRKVSDASKPYVHMTATSYDIIDSANAARYKDVMELVVIPSLMDLEKALIAITLREADTLQIARTHGQHAVPVTFGFAIAEYVSRLGNCIQALTHVTAGLSGKFSGAVGAYNASSLFFDNPEDFEFEVLDSLDLDAAQYSTQIVPPEPLTRLLSEIVVTAGVLANLADDMRHLQRTEIGEVGEGFGTDQVGSSTMPQKRNPITFENAKSLWKVIMPRMITVFMDQLSEHQRDLTNSASGRTYGEMFCYLVWTAERLTGAMQKLTVDRGNLDRNLAMQEGMIIAEPLSLILAALGHPYAHEKVRRLCVAARIQDRMLAELIPSDPELQPYMARMTPWQHRVLCNPHFYTGIAAKKARSIAEQWRKELRIEMAP